MKYRWEYTYENGIAFMERRYRLLVEAPLVTEPVEVISLREAFDLIGADHPTMPALREFFMNTRARMSFVPWKPFEATRELLEDFGLTIVGRVQSMDGLMEIPDADGWTWLHVFGDAAT